MANKFNGLGEWVRDVRSEQKHGFDNVRQRGGQLEADGCTRLLGVGLASGGKIPIHINAHVPNAIGVLLFLKANIQ